MQTMTTEPRLLNTDPLTGAGSVDDRIRAAERRTERGWEDTSYHGYRQERRAGTRFSLVPVRGEEGEEGWQVLGRAWSAAWYVGDISPDWESEGKPQSLLGLPVGTREDAVEALEEMIPPMMEEIMGENWRSGISGSVGVDPTGRPTVRWTEVQRGPGEVEVTLPDGTRGWVWRPEE